MFEITTLPEGYFEANCHLIILEDKLCIVDPCVDPQKLPAGLPPVSLLLASHGHFDHISHVDHYRKLKSARLLIHINDADCLTTPDLNLSVMMQKSTAMAPADGYLEDGQVINLNEDLDIKVIHTPGHTSGGVCFLLIENSLPRALFTGDTLFAGSIGRVDLGGDESDMRKSLGKMRSMLDDLSVGDLAIYPGHGPVTTLVRELSTNPYLNGMAF